MAFSVTLISHPSKEAERFCNSPQNYKRKKD